MGDNIDVLHCVDGIYNYVVKNFDRSIPGVLSGLTGDLVFVIEYCKYKQIPLDQAVELEIQHLIESSYDMSVFSFYTLCNGKSGINWFYGYLNAENLISNEELDLLTCDNVVLSKTALHDARKGNFDFLHGSLGHFYCLAKERHISVENLAFTNSFIQEIESFMSRHKNTNFIFPSFEYMEEAILHTEVSFGLAHGFIAILRYCLLCYKNEIAKERAAEIASALTAFLLKHSKLNSTRSHYPYTLNLEGKPKEDSRLGWCYGDLSIAYTLYQMGETFSRPDLCLFSLAVFQSCFDRKNDDSAGVVDASICHGSAGIAHIYNKMWHLTHDVRFKEEADFWIKRTLGYAVSTNNSIHFPSFSPTSNKYEKTDGILMGTSGVGLALLSYLNNDFSWDESIMLS